MKNLNLAVVEGNLTKDPEIKETPTGSKLCNFYIGVNRDYKDRDGNFIPHASFIKVTAWAKLAEICATYLKKGNRVLVNGVLRQYRWEDKDGKLHSNLQVIGKEIFFIKTGKKINAEEMMKSA
ncbi:MAG: single-stranded DNA-binding protein [Actinomycetia bacterium]|nr:single-stranded DNA-binding protein [Actinomycetes bacterium]